MIEEKILFKQKLGDFLAKLLRAALGRVITDLELIRAIDVSIKSVNLINNEFMNAKVVNSREEALKLALNSTKLEGFIGEFGVYKGESLNQIARYFNKYNVHGFDTFTGLPEFWREGFPEGAFDVSKEKLSFEKNCVLHKGLFDNTLPIFLNQNPSIAKFIHIDCDLYSSTVSVLTHLSDRIKPGTIILFDEYFNYPGWENHEYKAFKEFLSIKKMRCEYLAYNKFGQQVVVEIQDDNS